MMIDWPCLWGVARMFGIALAGAAVWITGLAVSIVLGERLNYYSFGGWEWVLGIAYVVLSVFVLVLVSEGCVVF